LVFTEGFGVWCCKESFDLLGVLGVLAVGLFLNRKGAKGAKGFLLFFS
jgi:hypothetical protein